MWTIFNGPGLWKGKHGVEVVQEFAQYYLPESIATQLPFTTDNELVCFVMLIFQLNSVRASAAMIKAKVAPSTGLQGWWHEDMFDAFRVTIPYIVFCAGSWLWAKGELFGSPDPVEQSFFIVCISTAFARMLLELLHSTLTRRQMSPLRWEILVPMSGVFVRACYPEHCSGFLRLATVRSHLSLVHCRHL